MSKQVQYSTISKLYGPLDHIHWTCDTTVFEVMLMILTHYGNVIAARLTLRKTLSEVLFPLAAYCPPVKVCMGESNV